MLARFVVILFVAISAAKERDVVSMCVKSGLANRLRAFISYLNLARRTDRSMRLYWYPEDQCPGLFTDVFSDLPADIVVDATPPSRVPRVRCTNAAYRRASISDMGKSALSVLHPAAAVQTRIDELLVLLRGTALTIATSSPIPSTLSNTTNTSNATHKASVTADRPFVAVHIRRTDNNENYHNDARFVEWIGRVSPGSDPVFVAADNAMSLRTLRAAFPDRIVSSDGFRSSKLRRHTSLETAVVDMWVASHATHFKGTYASTFSQFIEALRTARRAGSPGDLSRMPGDAYPRWGARKRATRPATPPLASAVKKAPRMLSVADSSPSPDALERPGDPVPLAITSPLLWDDGEAGGSPVEACAWPGSESAGWCDPLSAASPALADS